MIRRAYWESPVGLLEIGYDDAVVALRRVDAAEHPHEPAPLSDLVIRQLEEYFAGTRKNFALPIRPAGTAFQMAVWDALRQIPYGQVRSYGSIAAAVGKPNAARAVGMACHRNPIWILIPCHRVVGKNQSLTGYAGGLSMKQTLLELEKP